MENSTRIKLDDLGGNTPIFGLTPIWEEESFDGFDDLDGSKWWEELFVRKFRLALRFSFEIFG